MTLAHPGPVRAALPDEPDEDVVAHGYAWYYPDSAAYELSDPLDELDPLSDEDAVPDRA
jgi:hypothetical protein